MNEERRIASRRSIRLMVAWAICAVPVGVDAPALLSAGWLIADQGVFPIGVLVPMALLSVALLPFVVVSLFVDVVRWRRVYRLAEVCCACDVELSSSDTCCPGCGFDWNESSEDRPSQRQVRFGPGRCDTCGYSREGLSKDICPECGNSCASVDEQRAVVCAEWTTLRDGLGALTIGFLLTTTVGTMTSFLLGIGWRGIGLSFPLLMIVIGVWAIVRKFTTQSVNTMPPWQWGLLYWFTTLGWIFWFWITMLLLSEFAPSIPAGRRGYFG